MLPNILIISVIFMGILGATPLQAADLGRYQWEHRLLLIFAPSPSDQYVTALEKNLMAKSADVLDRDLIVYRIFETGTSYSNRQMMPPEDAEYLRRRFKARSGEIRLILIGKDGGVKMAGDEKTTLQSVFDLIDTMPMRRQEMRKQKDARNDLNAG